MGGRLNRLPNPFEEIGKQPPPPAPIAGFCMSAWYRVQCVSPEDKELREGIIELWWTACESWLQDVMGADHDPGNTT